MSLTFKTCALLLAAAVLTAGCGASGQEELQGWMAEQRRVTKPQVTPLTEPVNFKPQAYSQQAAVEPFTNLKLTQALKRDSAQAAVNATLIAPELSRRKEPLESAPLDTVIMVGSLVKQGRPVALVKIDSLLYQVRVGNYLGQNYGRITKISESELALREIVQDAAGEWIERTATLQLREATK